MPRVNDIFKTLDGFAPVGTKMDFDNVGLLVGRTETEVTRVLAALDATSDVIDEARETGARLIVTHHPVFFGLSRVTDESPEGRKALELIENGISVICMHTNLDAAAGGVNDALLEALGAANGQALNTENNISRMGVLPEQTSFSAFLAHTKAALECGGLRYHDAGRAVKTVGVCGGSGGDDIELAWRAGCDAFVTADIKYHQFLLAQELGIGLIDADHFCTENVVVPVLAGRLREAFPDVEVLISRRLAQTVRFF